MKAPKIELAPTHCDPINGDHPIVETASAYKQTRLDQLACRDLRDAIEFDTELKDTFGLAWLDDEAREPLLNALERVQMMIEHGGSTAAGIAVTALKTLLKGHLRGFGKYYSGKDPWPRPSEVVQAEIDSLMPSALEWLRVELEEALSEEADNAAKLPTGVADNSVDEASGASAGSQDAVATLRFQNDEPDPTDGRIMVAVDRRDHDGSPDSLSQKTKDYYVSCLRRIRADAELFSAGGIIWDQTGMDIPLSATTDLLDLKAVDPDLHRAFHAALFGLVTTTVGPVDLQAAVYVVGTFIREVRHYADMVKERPWQPPYGEHTAYCWAKINEEEPTEE